MDERSLPRDLLPMKVIAKLFRVSYVTVTRWRNAGLVKGYLKGARRRGCMLSKSEVEELVKRPRLERPHGRRADQP